MKTLDEVKQAVFAAIENRKDEIIAFGTDIWKHPEPGYREFRTSELAQEKLRKLGLPVKDNLAYTGFRADLDTGKPGPTAALLGEMDSLVLPSHPDADPQTGAVHACGHNTHITALIGAAIGLVDAGITDSLSGKIAFIGAPAEEGIELEYRQKLIHQGKIRYIAGKPELISCGALDGVDFAMMNHLGGFNVADYNGYIWKHVTFHGKSSHAAGPQYGINAMSAANLALHALALLKDAWAGNENVRVHGLLTHTGDAVNIVPDTVKMAYMLRANTTEEIGKLSALFDQAINGSAFAIGATAEMKTMHGSSPLNNDNILCDIYSKCMRELIPDAPVKIKTFHQPGCTDMGDISMIVPAIHGECPGCGGNCHAKDYVIQDPELAYVTASKLLASMVIETLYGDAEKGREITMKKIEKMSIPDYLNTIDNFSAHSFFPKAPMF